MADVQISKGHVKLANRIWEALLAAPFTGNQLRILITLFRLTYGWNKRSVTLTVTELATHAGCGPTVEAKRERAGGRFREDLAELIEMNVVVLVESGRGKKPSTFAFQKDFERWKGFSVSEQKLAHIWGHRPAHNDVLTRLVLNDSDQDSEEDIGPESGPNDREQTDQPLGLGEGPNQPEILAPDWAQSRPDKGLNGDHSGPKAGPSNSVTPLNPRVTALESHERHERQKKLVVKDHITGAGITHAHARSDSPTTATAIQRFLDARRPESRADWRSEFADLEHEYSAAIVERVALDCLMADNPPSTPGVFRIFCGYAAKAISGVPSNGAKPPAPIEHAKLAQLDYDERKSYDAERRSAGQDWRSDPENSLAFALLLGQAEQEIGAALQYPGGAAIAEQSAILKAADAAGFPVFDVWRWANGRSPP